MPSHTRGMRKGASMATILSVSMLWLPERWPMMWSWVLVRLLAKRWIPKKRCDYRPPHSCLSRGSGGQTSHSIYCRSHSGVTWSTWAPDNQGTSHMDAHPSISRGTYDLELDIQDSSYWLVWSRWRESRRLRIWVGRGMVHVRLEGWRRAGLSWLGRIGRWIGTEFCGFSWGGSWALWSINIPSSVDLRACLLIRAKYALACHRITVPSLCSPHPYYSMLIGQNPSTTMPSPASYSGFMECFLLPNAGPYSQPYLWSPGQHSSTTCKTGQTQIAQNMPSAELCFLWDPHR